MIAVTFSLDRNANAELAAIGAAIADADPAVAQARTVDRDVRYWLGFDIATGLFGDPSLGAKGNTATGPGSLGIRDKLSAPAQRGFNAAVAMHLGRAKTGDKLLQGISVAGNQLSRVPDVVGRYVVDAEHALRAAGYEPVRNYLKQPDPSRPYGYVSATVPPAGTLLAKARVELQIPRSAAMVGIGNVGHKDLQRRDGFDLDTGRYERITHGADIVLREHESTPAVDENGNTYYVGQGDYLDPSDGAVIVDASESFSGLVDGIVTERGYEICFQKTQAAIDQNRQDRGVTLERGIDSARRVTLCVRTSENNVAALEFSDPTRLAREDYKFEFAFFPLQQVSLKERVSK
jgi:hypothetical protein